MPTRWRRVPDGLDLIDAASLPLTSLTAHQAVDLLGPAAGRILLVTGGAGAVGGHALALARRGGWLVTALARPTDASSWPRGCRPRDRGVRPVRRGARRGGAGRAGARRGSRRWAPSSVSAPSAPVRPERESPRGPSRCSPTPSSSLTFWASPHAARSRPESPGECRCGRRHPPRQGRRRRAARALATGSLTSRPVYPQLSPRGAPAGPPRLPRNHRPAMRAEPSG